MSMTLQPPSKHDPFCFPVTDFGSCTAKSMLHTIEQTGIGIAYWDFHNHRVHWSKQLATLYGLDSAPFYRSCQDYLKYVYADDRFELKAAIEQVKQTLEKSEVEYRVFIDRQEKWFRSCFSPVVEQGGLSYVLEFVTDISELKSAQNALIYSELRWRSILGCVSDVLIETTFSGEIVSVTDSITSLWGYHSDELRGIHLLSIIEFEEGFSFEAMPSIERDCFPVSATANVLYKSLSCRTAQCSIHVDTIRQTLLFIFKPHSIPPSPPSATSAFRDAIASMTNALVDRYPLSTIYTMVSEILTYLLEADCIHIYQYHSEQVLWRTVYDYCQHSDLQCAARFELAGKDNPISHVLNRFEPTRINHWNEPNTLFESDFVEQLAGVCMVLPILVNTSIWGSILIMRFDEKHWTDQEFEQAILLGDYVNLAIAAQRR
jgi:PAS domain S-box-containing protein